MNTSDTQKFLKDILIPFAGLPQDVLTASLPYWRTRNIAKGGFYNKSGTICKDLGIVVKGIFRVYYCDPKTDEEKNIFFFSETQFIVSFRSFLYQYPCVYSIEAMEDAVVCYLPYPDLQQLYEQHKPWERFGRMLAEQFFHAAQGRTEDLLFFSHEQRYLNLIKAHPSIVERVAGFHLASYLGIKTQSLSRIKKRLQDKK